MRKVSWVIGKSLLAVSAFVWKELVHSLAEHFQTSANKLDNLNVNCLKIPRASWAAQPRGRFLPPAMFSYIQESTDGVKKVCTTYRTCASWSLTSMPLGKSTLKAKKPHEILSIDFNGPVQHCRSLSSTSFQNLPLNLSILTWLAVLTYCFQWVECQVLSTCTNKIRLYP